MKVLIADDEESISYSYKLMLESRKHKVFVSGDGEQCLRVFYEHQEAQMKSSGRSLKIPPFDLVILDYRMPKKNGVEVAEEILSAVPSQRIIIASAYNHEAAEEIKSLNRNVELLQKPFEFDVFVNAVEKRQATSSHACKILLNSASIANLYSSSIFCAGIAQMGDAFELRR